MVGTHLDDLPRRHVIARAAMYGGYRRISVVAGAGNAPLAARAGLSTVVAGPLCESGDVFMQAEGGVVTHRELPAPAVGDLLVLHDTGAYGASMSSNDNSRPLCAEVLVDGGTSRVIRRRQTIQELLALEDV